MAPEEYRWAKELLFFYENGSAVFMLVSLEDGNSVKPVFGFIYSFSRIFTWLNLLIGFLPVVELFRRGFFGYYGYI